jgi:hypothetical protein
MNILNRTSGNENDMSYSSEITGVVYIVVAVLLRFIINDMQKEISERNPSNGSFQCANLVMTPGIVDVHEDIFGFLDNFAKRSNAKNDWFTLKHPPSGIG